MKFLVPSSWESRTWSWNFLHPSSRMKLRSPLANELIHSNTLFFFFRKWRIWHLVTIVENSNHSAHGLYFANLGWNLNWYSLAVIAPVAALVGIPPAVVASDYLLCCPTMAFFYHGYKLQNLALIPWNSLRENFSHWMKMEKLQE